MIEYIKNEPHSIVGRQPSVYLRVVTVGEVFISDGSVLRGGDLWGKFLLMMVLYCVVEICGGSFY